MDTLLPAEWRYAPPLEPWLQILHEDKDIVVIDKIAGLLSVPGRGPALSDSAETRLRRDHPQAWAVHRLDLDTSGVLVFALRRRAEAVLHQQFRDRRVEKTYIARVVGHPTEDEGLIDLPLSPIPGEPRSRVGPGGKPARSQWRVLSRDPDDSSLIELHPETGRSHQLRLHLRAIGHPILGDRFYAPAAVVNRAPRLLLHALSLCFDHPYRGERMSVRAPLPFS